MGFLDDVRKNIENAVEDVKDNVSEALHLPGAEQGQGNVQDQSVEASADQSVAASADAVSVDAVVAEEVASQEVAPVAEVPAAVPEAAVAAPVEVSVQEGDSLSAIAAANGVDLDSLIAANPEIENPDLIYPGQLLRLP